MIWARSTEVSISCLMASRAIATPYGVLHEAVAIPKLESGAHLPVSELAEAERKITLVLSRVSTSRIAAFGLNSPSLFMIMKHRYV